MKEIKTNVILSGFKRKSARYSSDDLVKEFFWNSTKPKNLPLVLQVSADNVDPFDWAKHNRKDIQEKLSRYGAVLFRQFKIESIADFQHFAQQISSALLNYKERSSPRTEVGQAIYTSTDHPANEVIQFHNEQSYTKSWPMKLWFYCQKPASAGGETPIADGRAVLKYLSRETVEKFKAKKVLYRRNYGNGMGLTWEEAFQTNSRSEVEKFCRRENMTYEWKSSRHLRTEQIFDTVVEHPWTGEWVWFEHAAFFHVTGLPEEVQKSFNREFSEEDLPSNTYFGDGSIIEKTYLDEIRSAYARAAVKFTWQKNDVLLIDNMLVSHSREPFQGERRVFVAMADLYSSR